MRTRHRLVVRAVAVATLGSLGALVPVSPVAADAAGPGDYRTEIERVVPTTGAVSVSVHGGDSFLRLEVAPGSTVIVPGYRDEPFLRFDDDGTVHENVASATHLLSRDRYGGVLPEDFVDGVVEWRVVATDGSFAWHDHRIHWMSDIRPPGRRPGEVILRATVPIVVDGVPVSIEVRSTWLPAPSPTPVWLGLGVGAGLALAAGIGLLRRRRPGMAVAAALVGALSAVVVGTVEYRSLPSDVGPLTSWWLVPLVALGGALLGLGLSRFGTRHRLATVAVVAGTGVLLTVWAWPRRNGWDAAVLVTSAPDWLDRAVSAGVLAVGVGLTVAAVAALVAVVVAPARSLRERGADLTSAS